MRLPARRLRRLRAMAVLALALVLSACQPGGSGDALTPPNKGVAASLHLNALMDAAFGSKQQVVDTQQVRWRAALMLPPQQEARLPSSMLPASESAAASRQAPASRALPVMLQRTPVTVLPREVVRLNDTQAVLVFESVPADGDGRPLLKPTSKAMLGTVFYTRVAADNARPDKPRAPSEEQWQVSRFQPYIDALGYAGSAGDSQVYKLAPERYLLTFESESCWRGTCGRWLHGYLLQPDGLALVLQSRLAGNNRAAYPDCDARLSPQRTGPRQRRQLLPAAPQPASAAASAAAQGHSCFDVQGEVHPISREGASADVSLRFKGLVSTARGERQTVQETQLFRLNDGLYEQIDGGPNPVPEF